MRLPVPGRHLGLNSAAAVLTAYHLGLPVEATRSALAAFPGVRRRFERKGSVEDITVYDEYAYHPTSMTAALRTMREVAGDGRLLVVFQPYRVYRTRDLHAELAAALGLADEVLMLEVFGPGEERGTGRGRRRPARLGRPPRGAQGLPAVLGRRRRRGGPRGPAPATWC